MIPSVEDMISELSLINNLSLEIEYQNPEGWLIRSGDRKAIIVNMTEPSDEFLLFYLEHINLPVQKKAPNINA